MSNFFSSEARKVIYYLALLTKLWFLVLILFVFFFFHHGFLFTGSQTEERRSQVVGPLPGVIECFVLLTDFDI